MIEHAATTPPGSIPGTTLSPDTRRTQIADLLDREGEVGVEAMADRFGVSGMTIRRDLTELADAGRVIRTHGGAAAAARISFEFRFLERMQEQAKAKQQIAQVAAGLVEPGQTIMLDSSTTTLAIARQLQTMAGLTVITTSLPIASQLFGCQGIEVLLLGGLLRKDSPDLLGAITDNNLEILRGDVAFIGADAIDREGYIYNESAELGKMLSHMADAAERVYAVADHSKLDRRALMRFAHVRDWDGLITDDQADTQVTRSLKQRGAKVFQPKRKDNHHV